MSVSSYLRLRLSLIRSFLSGLLGTTATYLSSISRVTFSLLSTFRSVGTGIEADATWVPFDIGGIRGELSTGGLDVDTLLGVPPPFVLAALAACS
jgi:hypothetical protein